jgi:hypothetical protein
VRRQQTGQGFAADLFWAFGQVSLADVAGFYDHCLERFDE